MSSIVRWVILLSALKMEAIIAYDTIAEFNVDSKAECDQLNLAHVARKKYKQKKKLKQTNASAHLVQYRFKISEGSLERVQNRDTVMKNIKFFSEGTHHFPDPSPVWRGQPSIPIFCGLHLYSHLALTLAMSPSKTTDSVYAA